MFSLVQTSNFNADQEGKHEGEKGETESTETAVATYFDEKIDIPEHDSVGYTNKFLIYLYVDL